MFDKDLTWPTDKLFFFFAGLNSNSHRHGPMLFPGNWYFRDETRVPMLFDDIWLYLVGVEN